MTIGIKLPATDDKSDGEFFIYWDSVTMYTRTQRGQVTKNPTARGDTVTDNFTRENPTFSFSAVCTFADISLSYAFIRDENEHLANNYQAASNPVVVGTSATGLLNYLPDSIGQFLPRTSSSVVVDAVDKTDYKGYVEQCLEKLMSGESYDQATGKTRTKIRPIKLYEFTGSELTRIFEDVCLVGFDIRETPDTGNALFCDLSFEKVKFVKLKTAALSPDVVKALKPKAATKAKKGSVDSTVKNTESLKGSPAPDDSVDKAEEASREAGFTR
jgi:hypothetical protein